MKATFLGSLIFSVSCSLLPRYMPATAPRIATDAEVWPRARSSPPVTRRMKGCTIEGYGAPEVAAEALEARELPEVWLAEPEDLGPQRLEDLERRGDYAGAERDV